MTVHESRESWERFRDETLMPGLAGVDDGLPGPSEEMTFDVDVFHTRQRTA
jgi:hypothetical protein